MKGRPIDQLVYEFMFPKPRQSDPQNFHALLQRHLILEVRQEVHSFYGHLDTQEAKYPGLDYTHPTHRIRLSRWQWHRRLFRAFDALRLTHAEISNLTKWEGTKWAKERFEKEQGITIRDTTADDFGEWIEPEDRPNRSQRGVSQETEESREASPAGETVADEEEGEEEESDEEVLESVGVALNERLRERVALRNISGDLSMPIDEEWENWFKAAIESGELPHVADQIARQSSLTADDIFPPRMLAAARAGHWNEIPDFLHDMIRQGLDMGGQPSSSLRGASQRRSALIPPPPPPRAQPQPLSSVTGGSTSMSSILNMARSTIFSATTASNTGNPSSRRTYSELRIPSAGGQNSAAAAATVPLPPPRVPRTTTTTSARPGA